MQFQQLNRDDAETVFAIVKNISGAAIAIGAPAYFDTADATNGIDGHAVSAARTGQEYLFAGIAQVAIADDEIGRVQVYGKGSALAVVAATNVKASIGEQLNAVDSKAYLVQYTTIAGSSAPIANPWTFVTLMAAVDSGAGTQSTAVLTKVFIRAL